MHRHVSGTALAAVLALGLGPVAVHAETGTPDELMPKTLILAQASMEPDAEADSDAPGLRGAERNGESQSGTESTGATAGQATAGEVYDYEADSPVKDTGQQLGLDKDNPTAPRTSTSPSAGSSNSPGGNMP